ncbi:MAG: rhodanese-like domain-containing protein [Bacteroidota bacterium]
MKLSFSTISLVLFFVLPQVFTFTGCNGQTTSESSTPTAIFENIDLDRFEEMRASDDVDIVLLDVRTPGETSEGMIPGALHIDYRAADFAEQIAQLERDKTYLVYCKSGGHSARASQLMQELNFSEVYNLEVGYMGWAAAQ